MGTVQQAGRGNTARRSGLLAMAIFVALAPLCAAMTAMAPAVSTTAAHAGHQMGPGSDINQDTSHGSHAQPMASANATTSSVEVSVVGDPTGEHCAPHSCCAEALVKRTGAEDTLGGAILTASATTDSLIGSTDQHNGGYYCGAPPRPATAPAPLRL